MLFKWFRRNAKIIIPVTILVAIGALAIALAPGVAVVIAGAGAVILTDVLIGVGIGASVVAALAGLTAGLETKITKYEEMEKELEEAHCASIKAQEQIKIAEEKAASNSGEVRILSEQIRVLSENNNQLREQLSANSDQIERLSIVSVKQHEQSMARMDNIEAVIQKGIFSPPNTPVPFPHANGAQPRERRSLQDDMGARM